MQQIKIDLIRHGEPQGGDVIRGISDHPLTPLGVAQFEQRIQMHQAPWSKIISSPLLRCKTSAQTLSNTQNIPLMIDERIRELDFGDWENQPMSQLMGQKDAKVLWQNPMDFTPPNGEPVTHLRKRLQDFWQDLKQTQVNEYLLLICHGGVIRVLMYEFFNLKPEAVKQLSIPFAGFIRLNISFDEQHQFVSLELFDGQTIEADIKPEIAPETSK